MKVFWCISIHLSTVFLVIQKNVYILNNSWDICQIPLDSVIIQIYSLLYSSSRRFKHICLTAGLIGMKFYTLNIWTYISIEINSHANIQYWISLFPKWSNSSVRLTNSGPIVSTRKGSTKKWSTKSALHAITLYPINGAK